ncbi:transmembrane protein 218-like, partial [Saccoglossus kowalevskii]
NAVVGVFLGALVITLVLVFFPIEDPTASETVDYTIYDNTIIGRSLLVAFMGLFVIIGGVFVFIFHWMDPIQAKPLKKIF